MEKPISRPLMPIFVFIISLMIVVDVIVDQMGGHSWISSLVHLVFGGLVIFVAHILVNRAIESRHKAEEIMRQTQADLESVVNDRTVELNLANESLRKQISERVQAEIERELLIAQIEAARQKAENLVGELDLANNMLVTLIDTLPAAMVIVDHEERLVLANSQARKLMKTDLAGDAYGLRDEMVMRRRDGSIIQYDDLPLVRAIRGGEVTTGLEVECCLENGECVDLLIAASPVRNEAGAIVNAVKILLDITHIRKMEKALRESEEKYRAQFDAFPEPTTVWNREGRLLMQNLVSARNMNGTREDFVGKTIFEIFGAEGAGYLARIQHVIDNGETEYREDVVELPKGKRFFWTCIQRTQNPDGGYAAQVLSYDVTERRRIEEAVRDSEEKFSTVFHFSPNPVGILRLSDLQFMEINQAMSTLTGWSRSDLVGHRWSEVGFSPPRTDEENITRLFRENGSVRDYEVQITARSGAAIVLLLSLIPIAIGEEACVLAIAHDITERKRSEEVLRQTQAELARGIQERSAMQERQRLARELHDSVSQALYGISLGAHTALTLFESDRDKVLEALQYILSLAQAGLTEMRALIFELRPESLKMEGLVVAIGKQIAALRARHGIQVEYHACEEPQLPLKTKEALYRIAQEALHNAVKHAHPTRLDVDLCCDDSGISLHVSDDGCGFNPQAAFPGHLGLQSMRERAASVQGTFEILSEPDRGTHISLLIPRSSEAYLETGAASLN